MAILAYVSHSPIGNRWGAEGKSMVGKTKVKCAVHFFEGDMIGQYEPKRWARVAIFLSLSGRTWGATLQAEDRM